MKCYILLLLLISNSISFGQNKYLNFQINSANTLSIYKLLGISDSTSLLIKISKDDGGMTSETHSYVVAYFKNRKIDVFKLENKHIQSQSMQTNIQTVKVKYGKRRRLRFFLKSNLKKGNFNLDSSQLNIQEINEVGKELEMMEISDGVTYYFQIIKNNQFSTYSSYCPHDYIHENYPGSAERQKLLNIYEGYHKLVIPYFK